MADCSPVSSGHGAQVKKLPRSTTLGALRQLCEKLFKVPVARQALSLRSTYDPAAEALPADDDNRQLTALGVQVRAAAVVECWALGHTINGCCDGHDNQGCGDRGHREVQPRMCGTSVLAVTMIYAVLSMPARGMMTGRTGESSCRFMEAAQWRCQRWLV